MSHRGSGQSAFPPLPTTAGGELEQAVADHREARTGLVLVVPGLPAAHQRLAALCPLGVRFPAWRQLRRTASRPLELSVPGSAFMNEIVVRLEVALMVSANSFHACLWFAGCNEF